MSNHDIGAVAMDPAGKAIKEKDYPYQAV